MTNVPDKRSNINLQHNDMSEKEPNSGKGTQCFECEGYGHLRTKYLTKGLFVAWPKYDDEREGSNKVKAFTGKYDSSCESNEEGLTVKELTKSFKKLFTK